MLHSRDSPVKLRDPAPGVFQPVPGHLQHLKKQSQTEFATSLRHLLARIAASFMGLSCAHLNNKILSKQDRKDHLTEVLDVLCEAGVDGSKRVHELSHQQIHL